MEDWTELVTQVSCLVVNSLYWPCLFCFHFFPGLACQGKGREGHATSDVVNGTREQGNQFPSRWSFAFIKIISNLFYFRLSFQPLEKLGTNVHDSEQGPIVLKKSLGVKSPWEVLPPHALSGP